MRTAQRLQGWLSKNTISPFIPKSITCLFEGLSQSQLLSDILAGVTVGVVSIPFALALAAAAGLDPARGLYTAIIAGFIASLFGGSRHLITGPTGALIVLIFNVVQRFGYDGLFCASIEAALILIILGCSKCGRFVKYIPYPVVIGFSMGIAVALITSQLRDFFGLDIPKPTIDIVDKLRLAVTYAHTTNMYSTLIASFTLAIIILVKKFWKNKPGTVIALSIVTAVVTLFHLPVETIESKFGTIPQGFPAFSWPTITFDLIRRTFPTALGIALIGAIESLVAAVVIDGITGEKHKSNCQLIAQGLANLGSALFGGIPATGSLARTHVSLQMRAQTPLAGMIHSATILAITMLMAPMVSKVPLPALSAVLVFIGCSMFDFEKIHEILKGHLGEALIMFSTLLITLFVDVNTAVQTGILASVILFLKRSSETTVGTILLEMEDDPETEQKATTSAWKRKLPDDVKLYEIEGPLFFAVTDLLTNILNRFETMPRVLIVRMRSVPFIDSTGIDSLKQFSLECKKYNVELFLSELKPSVLHALERSDFFKSFSKTRLLTAAKQALHFPTMAGQQCSCQNAETCENHPKATLENISTLPI